MQDGELSSILHSGIDEEHLSQSVSVASASQISGIDFLESSRHWTGFTLTGLAESSSQDMSHEDIEIEEVSWVSLFRVLGRCSIMGLGLSIPN